MNMNVYGKFVYFLCLKHFFVYELTINWRTIICQPIVQINDSYRIHVKRTVCPIKRELQRNGMMELQEDVEKKKRVKY